MQSTYSVKKYYALPKGKNDKRSQKKNTEVTTYRGYSNAEQNKFTTHRRSCGNTLKIYNSSTDLNNTTNSS
jgi:hypothetical protein